MQNKNSNNENWKHRLDDFEESASFELNASWEKLGNKRLSQETASKKTSFWMVAASTILIALLTLTITRKSAVPETETTIIKINSEKKSNPVNTIVYEDKQAIKTLPLLKETTDVVVKPTAVVLKKPVKEKEIPLVSIELMRFEEIETIDTIDTIAIPTIAVTPQPKKLKLVHINEINSMAGKEELVQQEGKPYFPISYKTKQSYSNTDDNNKTGKDNLIRIKLN